MKIEDIEVGKRYYLNTGRDVFVVTVLGKRGDELVVINNDSNKCDKGVPFIISKWFIFCPVSTIVSEPKV